jgi:hypothetical protein
MLRHKAYIQCARLAFSLSGIYDIDEIERMQDLGVVQRVETQQGDIKRVDLDAMPEQVSAVDIATENKQPVSEAPKSSRGRPKGSTNKKPNDEPLPPQTEDTQMFTPEELEESRKRIAEQQPLLPSE